MTTQLNLGEAAANLEGVELLDAKQIAELIGCKVQSVHSKVDRLIAEAGFPRKMRIGKSRSVYWSRKAVFEWLESQYQKATDKPPPSDDAPSPIGDEAAALGPIERGVPMPKRGAPNAWLFQVAKMAVGDSAMIHVGAGSHDDFERWAATGEIGPVDIRLAAVDGGFRIWRIS